MLAAGGLWCLRAWDRRNGRRTALALGSVGTGAFVLSHVLAPQIGAWPSVLDGGRGHRAGGRAAVRPALPAATA